MSFRDLGTLTLLFGLALAGTAGATYAGDRPLNTMFFNELNGDYLFSMGDSYYSSPLDPGATYTVNYTIPVPVEAEIRFQRLYVYWGWSRIDQKAIYPVISLNDSRRPGEIITLLNRYSDSKGFVSKYDFFSGLDAYDIPRLQPGENIFSVTLHQDGPPNSSVLCFGMAVLAVYEQGGSGTLAIEVNDSISRSRSVTVTTPGSSPSMIWVLEGSDLLHSSYGVSPEMASTVMTFDGKIPDGKISTANLFLVAPSGGYSRDFQTGINKLFINRFEEEKIPALFRPIFSLLFPNYTGMEWSDVFNHDNATQIGFETREIKPYLRTENNKVTVSDLGDYFQMTNAILSIHRSGERE